jgi:[NiFe] hydrogenase assembly HybE family chaperone
MKSAVPIDGFGDDWPADAVAALCPRLEAAFRAAAEGMQGLPLVNQVLEVEAVGFAPWEDRWLGVMVTPWFMNLMLVPRDPSAWNSLAPGAKRRYRFPAGEYEFVGAHDATFGEYQVCSLFSPVGEFEDHATARLVAQLAREALFDPANAEVPDVSAGAGSPPETGIAAGSDARSDGAALAGPLAQLEAGLAAPLSKRDFLRARFLAADRDDRG